MRRVSVLVSVVVVGIASALLVIPAVAQDATPAVVVAFPLSPGAAECMVEPRPLADFERLLLATPQVGSSAPASPTPFAMPEGEPADAGTASGVTATLVEIFACYSAGDPRRFHALYTDEGLQRAYPPGMVTQEFFDDFFAASPVPSVPEARPTILAVEDVVVLADGRVGTLLRSDEPDFGGLQAVYYIFARVGERYLVDDVIHGLPTDGGTPTP